MTKNCLSCGLPFREGQHIRATVLAVYHQIPSAVSYALSKPYECERIAHLECSE